MNMRRLAIFVLLVALSIQIYAATFARMEADDYEMSVSAESMGIIGSVVDRYEHFYGRYSQTAVTSAFYLIFGLRAPVAVAITSLLALVLATTYALRPWSRDAFLLALAFSWGLLSTLPNWYQSFLWLPGNVTYFLPLAVLVALLGYLSRSLLPLSLSASAKQ